MNTTEQIVNTAFFYVKEGAEKDFEKFRNRAHVLLESYGAKVERMIQPAMVAAGDFELPTEVHFATYPSLEAMHSFNQNAEFLELKEKYLASSLNKMYGFVTKNDDFQFFREHGDASKTFGVALIWYKDGEEYAKQFEEYHHKACEIIPEFGAHFERFLIPIASANEALEQPSEIHRFYFESQDGMEKMASDQRMMELFPLRDASLKNLVFILGKSL